MKKLDVKTMAPKEIRAYVRELFKQSKIVQHVPTEFLFLQFGITHKREATEPERAKVIHRFRVAVLFHELLSAGYSYDELAVFADQAISSFEDFADQI